MPSSPIREHYKGQLDWLADSTILLVKAGSRAHGMATPESDLDLRGICVAPLKYYYSFRESFEQEIQLQPTDLIVYEIRKYFSLAAACNPNILELLFQADDQYSILTPEGRLIRENRYHFLSKRAKNSFGGYAMAQLRKLQNSFDVDSPQNKKNPKRAELISKYGYDTKHALHLVRLLRMGSEILRFGRVEVFRRDHEELVAIKNGAWTYDRLQSYVTAQQIELEDAAVSSTLPELPDYKTLDDLCREITGRVHSRLHLDNP